MSGSSDSIEGRPHRESMAEREPAEESQVTDTVPIEAPDVASDKFLRDPEIAARVREIGEKTLKSRRGESEYVVRSIHLPDRRLPYSDQRLLKQVRAAARTRRAARTQTQIPPP
jgi:hypothetical protein